MGGSRALTPAPASAWLHIVRIVYAESLEPNGPNGTLDRSRSSPQVFILKPPVDPSELDGGGGAVEDAGEREHPRAYLGILGSVPRLAAVVVKGKRIPL